MKPAYLYGAIATIILLVIVIVKLTIFTSTVPNSASTAAGGNAAPAAAAAITDPLDPGYDCPPGSAMAHPVKGVAGTYGCDGKIVLGPDYQYTKRNTGRTY
ncbi:hypothetical protein OOT33_17325 [Sphingobium sp. DEHP117]|uniref:hypothetical protein n=1 Tax=Sphingobium sp. DEHP117 TaxID=2993436 RepID=UPI0027D61892|nr:hypothetical protein [Sphingobium sp. DEHP117]MDQ4422174.1 hypothetical protein [Sphingobium sp. DEHP117]